MEESKRVPVVGDTWRCRIGDEFSDWLLLSHADEEWQVARVDGPQAGAKGILLDAYFFAGPWGDANEFVRSAAPPKEQDWARWLPPTSLALSGNKEFIPGRIFASFCAGKAIVWRCIDRVPADTRSHGDVEILASNDGRWGQKFPLATSSLYAQYGVLVADVGCEPADPSVLYGKPASPPVVEAPRLAQRPTALSKCPVCSGLMVANVIHGCPNYGRALMLEQGPGLAAKYANPCRLVACGHRACTSKSTEPWHSNFDDADLMGRDV